MAARGDCNPEASTAKNEADPWEGFIIIRRERDEGLDASQCFNENACSLEEPGTDPADFDDYHLEFSGSGPFLEIPSEDDYLFTDLEWESPPEVTQVQAATSIGDIGAVKAVFQQWRQTPESRRIDKNLFNSALSTALKNNCLSIAVYLLENGVAIYDTQFQSAMEKKAYPFLQLYLNHGFDLNAKHMLWRNGPLLDALDDELTKWLLNHGADPNITFGKDFTPISMALYRAPFSIIKLLLDGGGSIERGQLLHHASQRVNSDRLEVVAFILDNGGLQNINKTLYQDSLTDWVDEELFGLGTPLHGAAEDGALDVIELLLARGADPSIKDSKGLLPIDRARREGHQKAVESLFPLTAPSSKAWSKAHRL